MNKFFQFNDLYSKAEYFYEIKGYLSCLAYLNKALSFDFPISEIRLTEAFEIRGLVKMQLNRYKASIIDFNNGIKLNPEKASIFYYRHLMNRSYSLIVLCLESQLIVYFGLR